MIPQFLPISSLTTAENRQRKDFSPSAIMELMESIGKPGVGLLHPIVVRQEGDATILVAGERRLRAFSDATDLGTPMYFAGVQVSPGHIPYILIGELDPLDAWEAELEENIRRKDLTWQEAAKATAALLEMRTKVAERDGTSPPTITELSEELRGNDSGKSRIGVRSAVLVARHLSDPDVAGAESLEKALKVLKRKEETARHTTRAAELGKTMTRASHTLVNGDAKEWAEGQPDGTYHVILTDPPYGMGADEFGDRGGRTMGAHGYEDSSDSFQEMLSWLPEETFRLAAPEAHLYLFCDIDWFPSLKDTFTDAGWRVFRTPLIWHKPTGFLTPWVEQGPQRRYETILYAMKGTRKVQRIAGDVITVPPDDNLGHAAQKPVELFRELLSRSATPGDQVLDLYCGTGPIFPAAHTMKCRATGVEIDPAPYAIAAKRVEELK